MNAHAHGGAELGLLAAAWIGERARILEGLLADLAREPRRDTVHDTRVACRRLREALRFFAPELPAEPCAKLEAAARRLMRVLAPLRELDVAQKHLRRLAPAESRVLHKALARARRRLADDDAQRRQRRASKLGRALAMTLAHVPDGSWRAAAAASPAVRAGLAARTGLRHERVAELIAALPERPKAAELHRVRIALKHWRYATELGRPAAAPSAKAAALTRELRRLSVLGGACQDLDDLARLVARHGARRTVRDIVKAARKQAAADFAAALRTL